MIQRILPMLAVAGEPFDSDEHLYEVKWDGVRCLAGIEHGTLELWGALGPRTGGLCLLAAERDGVLDYVGEVCCGFSRREWAKLAGLLPGQICPKPIVPCRKKALWLEPGLYCQVRSLGWTKRGRRWGLALRGACRHLRRSKRSERPVWLKLPGVPGVPLCGRLPAESTSCWSQAVRPAPSPQ